MVFSSRRISNTSFSQRMVFALHPPHERITRNFKASSAYWRLDFQSSMFPQTERLHTTPMPTKRENTLLDRMSKQWRWICSCGSSVRFSEFRANISFKSRNRCRIRFDALTSAYPNLVSIAFVCC